MTSVDIRNVEKFISKVIVEKEGKEVFIVVPNIKSFKTELVEKMTTRPNKRRTDEKRFHWLVYNFVRSLDGMQKKYGLKIRLMAKTDKEDMFRNEKGHFVTLEKIRENPDLVARV